MTLGEKLYKLRTDKGVTQAQLAGQLHVTRQTVSKWEVGEAIPSADNLKRLSAFFNVPIECFVETASSQPAAAESEFTEKGEAKLELISDLNTTDSQVNSTDRKKSVSARKKWLIPTILIGGVIIAVVVIILLSLFLPGYGEQTWTDDANHVEVSTLPEGSFNLTF